MPYKTGSWGQQAKERSKKRNKYFLDWRKKHPIHHKAHRLLAYAVKTKKLFKTPCEKCGNLKVEAHHDDHSKPLEVRWLCPKHHREADGRKK